jgi:serine/threonine protein kinase
MLLPYQKLPRVQLSDLRSTTGGVPIAIGGRGTIFPVTPKRRLGLEIVLNGEYLVKTPRTALKPYLSAAYEHHLDVISTRLKSETSHFESRMAVPRAIVEHKGSFFGFLMKEFSEGCYFTKTFTDGAKSSKLLELKEFLNSETERNRLNVPKLTTLDRVSIIADMFTTLTKLHEQDLIVGDLSGSNLLLQKKASRLGKVRVLFLDVDSFWHGQEHHTGIPESTLHWRSPEELKDPKRNPSKASDVYKASLMVRRLFHQETVTGGSSFDIYSSRIANEVLLKVGGVGLTELVALALSHKVNERPRAMQMAFHFKSAADHLSELSEQK